MSDPNDAWRTDAPSGGDGYGSPRREDTNGRSPRRDRDRSRSPARNGDAERPTRESDAANTGSNLHVSGLSRSVDVPMLESLFSKHGKVESASVMLDPHTQESRGFGFVKMTTAEEAEAAIAALNGMNFEGKSLTIAHARRGRARTPTPGRYHGVKVDIGPRGGYGYQDRPYQPRSYDSRYADRGPPPRDYYDRRDYDRRDYGGRRDDYYDRPRGDYGRRDDYDRRDRYDDYSRGPPPRAGGGDPYYRSERPDARRDDRVPPRGGYDERPRY
ncbi:hypothetical protein BD324DRAFT_616733 [Kockovaella imperatae]|uniref:RRM domain-containing protein n=1 Tax=Kockovaella imperatae TaxID=4999 RepID=A0A1Y1URR8_9TREE|nr:hypothetical protein BD324DRAFT_616733 [Kockovaella imperatae]ORX40194.1 hypothetical protein BD324DRAFT_616733 [Kockovaella imperatae]